jgi:hypothetical protein
VPTPGVGLDWARGALDTRHRRVECGWRRPEDGYTVEVLVPQNVPTELVLPDVTTHIVPAGRHTYDTQATAQDEQLQVANVAGTFRSAHRGCAPES